MSPIWKAERLSKREVLEGDQADTEALSARVATAVEVVNRIVAHEEDGVVRSLTADKGYLAIEEIAQIQEFDIRTVIGGRPRCSASPARIDRPVAQSSSSRRLCREEPVGQGAIAQARHAPGT